jgi:hypothetical protein
MMFKLVSAATVVFVDFDRIEVLARKILKQPADACLDEVNTGRFERLHESTRQPQRHAITVPELFPPSRREFQQAWR